MQSSRAVFRVNRTDNHAIAPFAQHGKVRLVSRPIEKISARLLSRDRNTLNTAQGGLEESSPGEARLTSVMGADGGGLWRF